MGLLAPARGIFPLAMLILLPYLRLPWRVRNTSPDLVSIHSWGPAAGPANSELSASSTPGRAVLEEAGRFGIPAASAVSVLVGSAGAVTLAERASRARRADSFRMHTAAPRPPGEPWAVPAHLYSSSDLCRRWQPLEHSKCHAWYLIIRCNPNIILALWHQPSSAAHCVPQQPQC